MDDAPTLPLPSVEAEELLPQVHQAMQERNFNQTAVCVRLSISPVYFSLWLRRRQMPPLKQNVYTYVLEQWVKDAAFHIDDPAITGTKQNQAFHCCACQLRAPLPATPTAPDCSCQRRAAAAGSSMPIDRTDSARPPSAAVRRRFACV